MAGTATITASAIFGAPGGQAWAWRFEGHHLSVTAAVAGRQVVVAPLFLGADPARVTYGEQTIAWPLRCEEELARALLADLAPALRDRAVVADTAPADISDGNQPARERRVGADRSARSGAPPPSARPAEPSR